MLRIALRDGEKVVVNGAVLRSVGRTEICVESKASILRGREIMAPEDADTPAKQLYFYTMMAYVDPDGSESFFDRIVDSLQIVSTMLPFDAARESAAAFARHAAQRQFYKALGECRDLIRLEKEAIGEAA